MPKAYTLQKSSEFFSESLACAFCHTAFRPGDVVVFCPRDQAIHHSVCWLENGNRCAVHGRGYLGLGRDNEARFEFERALVIEPDQDDVRTALEQLP